MLNIKQFFPRYFLECSNNYYFKEINASSVILLKEKDEEELTMSVCCKIV